MIQFLQKHIYSTILVVLALSLILGSWIAHQSQERFSDALKSEIEKQREVMASIAIITDRNGADQVIGDIVVDCARRNEFDALLITLGTLSKQDLLVTQGMFESCGEFYPTQKALMVMRLEEEHETYTRLLAMQDTLLAKDAALESERVLWDELVTLEKTRSGLLKEQAAIQEEIIRELVSGASVSQASVRTFVAEGQEIAKLLAVYDKRIDELRSNLNI